MHDVICIGSATRDVFLKSTHFHLDHLPLGSKVTVDELYTASGGAGTNTAVTFSRQGYHTACVAIVGKDMEGSEVIQELNNEGVDTEYLATHDDGRTAYSVILVDPSGERTILGYKGEGQHFDKINILWASLKAPWWYLSSLGGFQGVLTAAVQTAREQNAKIAFNPGGNEIAQGLEHLKPAFAQTDILFVNKDEAALLTGMPLPDWRGALQALKSLTKGIVSISDGHNGVVVMDTEGALYKAEVPNSPVIERTGAGDAYGAGFVAQIMRNDELRMKNDESIIKAIQFATANASSVVGKYGAKEGILKKDNWGPWPLVEVKKI